VQEWRQLELEFDIELPPLKETDEVKLFRLQKETKAGDNKALGQMYEKFTEIALKIIGTISQKNASVKALSVDEKRQKAHDASTYIIEQYLKRPDFEIKKSMVGYLYLRVLWELYGAQHQRKCDAMLDYRDELPERGSATRYRFIITDTKTGDYFSCETLEEIAAKFPTLRRPQILKCIETGCKWRNYTVDVLEV